jgi:hypothetical protein
MIFAIDPERRTNAQAIADYATLGILRDTDRVLDLTVGPHAGLWKLWRPDVDCGGLLVTNDLDPNVAADHHFDATALPFRDRAFDVSALDLPYGYRGTSRLDSDQRYGLRRPYRTANEIDALLFAGTVEALRVASRLVLVKCQDQNVSDHYRGQPWFVRDVARRHGAIEAGWLAVNARREQPSGKCQHNVWGYPSVLLVFEVRS